MPSFELAAIKAALFTLQYEQQLLPVSNKMHKTMASALSS